MLITKTSARSRVHRQVPMDMIGIKHFRDGRPSGGVQVVGLFTATAYTRSTRNIPYLRRKVAGVLARAGFTPDSHSGRTLANVLDTYPRDELFQIDEDTLVQFRADHPAAQRAAAGAGARPLRFLRTLRLGPRLCAARALRQRRPRRHRTAARGGLQRRGRLVRSVFPRRPAGARAFHHRAPRRAARPSRPRRARSRRVAGDEDVAGFPARGAARRARPAGGARISSRAMPKRSRRPIATLSPPRRRCRTSRPSSRCRPKRRSASTSSARRAATAAPASSCGATAGRCRSPSACRCSSTWASPSSTRAPITPSRRDTAHSSSGSTTCCSPSTATARSISMRCAESSTTASPP